MARALRDTDADWRRIGEEQPHWGVLTDPRYLQEAMDGQTLEAFYESGRVDVRIIREMIQRGVGVAPAGPVLDFGCGVGRLTQAMAEILEPVTGYDVSPGMLALAKARGGRAIYVDALPDGPFGWINAYIVFQHIPPVRGFALMADLLKRLAPGGVVSLHVICDHDARPPGPAPAPETVGVIPDGGVLRRALRRLRPSQVEQTALIGMYDYDLTMVARLFRDGGVGRLTLEQTNHGGHLGYIVLGGKPAA